MSSPSMLKLIKARKSDFISITLKLRLSEKYHSHLGKIGADKAFLVVMLHLVTSIEYL